MIFLLVFSFFYIFVSYLWFLQFLPFSHFYFIVIYSNFYCNFSIDFLSRLKFVYNSISQFVPMGFDTKFDKLKNQKVKNIFLF